ncbi:hypothetical protein S820908_156 [Synechococcus phage S-CAM9]|uniref:Uncharacterized protein n=1 Tax=Synechococcus phage S-CAM9 TaxID=1883369 RepID=A0A1D8KQ36_9CAUD|nr:hypothetical protein BOW85_gp092 [Synechococcus phage S-CAM9]AOV60303.1 hypothetical protein S050808_156 [Synechococcus phage S-CAM9]AOV60531.1 hypothetical protein S820908_156 [Synechococcus phage S-CAM9]AOV60760.1 hypothetical protein N161109_157 [Synechococcus phage S-CAM9]
MALWGNNDNVTVAGTVVISGTTVTGTATTFTDFSVGQVITVGAGQTQGFATIVGITSDTLMTIADVDALDTGTISGASYIISDAPIYLDEDPAYAPTSANAERDYTGRVHGVAANTPNRTHVAHAGWVGVTTYVDTHGNLRTKSEVYVAASGISTGNTVLPPNS